MAGTVVGPIGTLGATKNYRMVGGVYLPDVDENNQPLIVLRGHYGGSTLYSTCMAMNGSGYVGYTPSGANKFRVKALQYFSVGGTGGPLGILYADNDVGFASTTAPTNPVGPGGYPFIPALSLAGYIGYTSSAVTSPSELGFDFLVLNSKYLWVNGDGGAQSYGTVNIYGYEEA